MRIEHVAIWVTDLEKMREFYSRYFNGRSNQKYHNPKTGFSSYFITFDNDTRLELMHRPDIAAQLNQAQTEHLGYIHIAIATGSTEAVDHLTEQLRQDGYKIAGKPRTTGDGYYESVILDPEGNRIEITS